MSSIPKIADEYTRECLAIDVARKLTGEDVLERLSDLFVPAAQLTGAPAFGPGVAPPLSAC